MTRTRKSWEKTQQESPYNRFAPQDSEIMMMPLSALDRALYVFSPLFRWHRMSCQEAMGGDLFQQEAKTGQGRVEIMEEPQLLYPRVCLALTTTGSSWVLLQTTGGILRLLVPFTAAFLLVHFPSQEPPNLQQSVRQLGRTKSRSHWL